MILLSIAIVNLKCQISNLSRKKHCDNTIGIHENCFRYHITCFCSETFILAFGFIR